MLTSPVLRLVIAACVLALTAGCAQQQQLGSRYDGRSAIEQHQKLLRGEGLFPEGAPLPALEPVELLAVNDDMRAFLRKHVPTNAMSEEVKARRILKGLLDEGLRLHYNNLKTFTAEEAFYAREGNCLSFTNLYMALAREAGLIVMYQEVEVPPAWSAVGDTHYYSLHINVLLDFPNKQQVVDFDHQADNSRWRSHPVGDDKALAQYHNNMAVHHLTQKDYQLAFLHSREAIELRPNTGYFWANLGTIFKRAGVNHAAEEAYLVAINMTGSPTAVSNLARLYKRQGRTELAEKYGAMAEAYRMQNPYYLFELASLAYEQGDYPRASELLKDAIRKRKDEHEFHHLQGMTWAQLGDARKAGKSFAKASRLVSDPEMATLYQSKLSALADQN